MTASASRNSWVGFSSRRNEFVESTGTSVRLLFRRLERLLACHARPVRRSMSLGARWRGLLLAHSGLFERAPRASTFRGQADIRRNYSTDVLLCRPKGGSVRPSIRDRPISTHRRRVPQRGGGQPRKQFSSQPRPPGPFSRTSARCLVQTTWLVVMTGPWRAHVDLRQMANETIGHGPLQTGRLLVTQPFLGNEARLRRTYHESTANTDRVRPPTGKFHRRCARTAKRRYPRTRSAKRQDDRRVYNGPYGRRMPDGSWDEGWWHDGSRHVQTHHVCPNGH